MITKKLPARFTRDWLDSADGEFFNTGESGTEVRVIRETDRTVTIEAGPKAIQDLRNRAQCYVEETFDDPSLRGLQASARATLKRLAL